MIVFELHTYSSLSEVFVNHYSHCLDDCDKAVVFYDYHAVALKRLEKMTDERIKVAFSRDDLQVVHTKDELVALLMKEKTDSVVAGFLSSGDFNGLTTDDLKKIYS